MTFNIQYENINDSLRFTNHFVNLHQITKRYYWNYDPFKFINIDIIRDILVHESTLFSSSSDRSRRQSMINFKTLPKLPVFNLNMVDYDNDKPLTSARDVRFCEIPLSLVVYIISITLAGNKHARLTLKRRLNGIDRIPKVFTYFMTRIRTSQCGTMEIIPSIDKTSNNEFLADYTTFTNTVFDSEWLLSEDGLEFASDFLTRLIQIPDIYIDMEPYTQQTIPPFTSKYHTTLCAFFNTEDDKNNQTVGLLSGHTVNFDNKFLGLLVMNATLFCPYITNSENIRQSFVGHPQFDCFISSTLITDVIVLSTITDTEKDTVVPSNETTTTSTNKRSRHGRRRTITFPHDKTTHDLNVKTLPPD